MNYLELCQKTRKKCRISGSGPTTVIDQTGMYEKVVEWVQEAWEEIQRDRPDWDWMRKVVKFDTVAAQPEYTETDTGLTDLDRWWPTTCRIYNGDPFTLPGGGAWTWDGTGGPNALWYNEGQTSSTYLDYIEYAAWGYNQGAGATTDDQPQIVTVGPNNSLILTPAPDDVYTILCDYQRDLQTMTLDTDIPEMPVDLHMAIVWKAVMYFAEDKVFGERRAVAENNYNVIMNKTNRDQRTQAFTSSPPIGG